MTDHDSFAALIHRHQSELWRYLRFLGCDPALADDLTQDAFLAALEHPFEQRGERAEAAWLRTTARRRYLNILRKEGRSLPLGGEEEAEQVWQRYTELHAGEDRLEALHDCLNELDARSLRAVKLSYQEGLSGAEASRAMECSEDALKSLLKRARATLRDCVKGKLNIWD